MGICQTWAREIAKELGQTLVAPVVTYVPEGDYEPPTGHLRFPDHWRA
jgi:creatinine amidohydrolase